MKDAGYYIGIGFRDGLASTRSSVMSTARSIANAASDTISRSLDESEETEVKKDIEWAIKEIEGLKTETSENYPHEKMIEKGIVLGILKELD